MTTATETPINAFQILAAPLRGIWEMAFAPARHAARLRKIEALRGLSDAELAARGLERGDILRHVYRAGRTG